MFGGLFLLCKTAPGVCSGSRLGRIETRQLAENPRTGFRDAEFRVFSQWGEDGLIQYLLSRVPTPNKVFVEFGVENYLESNSRFLVLNTPGRGW